MGTQPSCQTCCTDLGYFAGVFFDFEAAGFLAWGSFFWVFFFWGGFFSFEGGFSCVNT
jgi:hypothetical protein